MRFWIALLGTALGLTSPASGGELDRTFPVGAAGKLVIALDFGSVAVLAHDADEVRIEATASGVGASSVSFDARSVDGQVRVESDAEPWVRWLRSAPGVRVRAWVPRAYPVEVHAADGVEVLDASGGVSVLAP